MEHHLLSIVYDRGGKKQQKKKENFKKFKNLSERRRKKCFE